MKGVEVEETRETTRTTTATTKATTTACFFFFRGEEKTKVKGAFFYLSFVLVSKRRLLRLFVQRGKRTWTRILRSWDGRERSAGSNEVAARSSHQKNACSSRRLSMASASTPFALTPPGLCFPSPCSPGRQTTCTRHERARDKNKRRSPRGYAETVKSWRVWSFLFPHGDETPTRSLPLPFFRLLSSSPASPPSPHLPSFLQPTKQVSFPLLFLGVEPCAAGRGGNVLERRGKRRSIEEALEGPARRFHGGGGPRNQRALSKSSRAVCDAFRSLVLVSVDVEPRTTLRCMPLCGSVDGGKRGETKPARSLSRGFPVDESRRPKKSSVQSNTPTPPPITTAMADAPVIAPKSAFEDRWNGIVRPYSQVSENTWERD